MTLRAAKRIVRRNRAGAEHRRATYLAALSTLRRAYVRRRPWRWCCDLGLWSLAELRARRPDRQVVVVNLK